MPTLLKCRAVKARKVHASRTRHTGLEGATP